MWLALSEHGVRISYRAMNDKTTTMTRIFCVALDFRSVLRLTVFSNAPILDVLLILLLDSVIWIRLPKRAEDERGLIPNTGPVPTATMVVNYQESGMEHSRS